MLLLGGDAAAAVVDPKAGGGCTGKAGFEPKENMEGEEEAKALGVADVAGGGAPKEKGVVGKVELGFVSEVATAEARPKEGAEEEDPKREPLPAADVNDGIGVVVPLPP